MATKYVFNPVTGNLDATDVVAFNGEVEAGTAAAPSIFFTGDPNTGIYSPGADQLALSTNGTGRLFVDASGNVGIGVSPSATLEVNGESRFTRSGVTSQYVGITADETNTRIVAEGSSKNLVIKNNSLASSVIRFDQAVASSYIFSQAGNERLRITSAGQLSFIGAGSSGSPAVGFNGSAPSNSLVIDSAGLVGIGTSSPGSIISIERSSAGSYTGTNSTAGDKGIDIYNTQTTNDDSFSSLSFRVARVNSNIAGGSINLVATGAGSGAFAFVTRNEGVYGERVRITSNGRLGIGTTSPGTKFHVVTGANAGIKVNQTLATGSWSAGDYTQIGLGVNNQDTVQIRAIQAVSSASSYASDIAFINRTTNTMSEKARIDSFGTFRVKGAGTAGVNDAVQLNGSAPANSLLLDASGRLLVGTSSSTGNTRLNHKLAVVATSAVAGGARLTQYAGANPTSAPLLELCKSRGSSDGSFTSVVNGDTLGYILWHGADGTDNESQAGSIACQVDGTPGTDDMPGRLVFSVTADGAASPTEALRISSNRAITVSDGGNVVLGTTTGTKIGTTTTQKLGFYNATPVVQPAAVADATAATVITQLNDLLAKLRTLGIIAT